MTKTFKSNSSKSIKKKRAKLRQPRREKEPVPSQSNSDEYLPDTVHVQVVNPITTVEFKRVQYSRDAKHSSHVKESYHTGPDSESDNSNSAAVSCQQRNDDENENENSSDISCRISESDSDSDRDSESDYDVGYDSNDSNNTDGVDVDKEDSEQCNMQLIEQGLDEHLKSPVCNKSISMTQTMLMRYTRFLVWLWKLLGASLLVQGGIDVCYLISAFIVQHSQLLPKYYSHLKDAYLFKASTILDHNDNFQVLVHWYAVYRVHKDTFPVDPSQLYTINLIIKSMRKAFSRERKIQEATSTDNTIEGLVKSRKWPVGGLQELSDAVGSQMEWARRLCVKGCIISLSIYNLFMQVFMSSLFTSK